MEVITASGWSESGVSGMITTRVLAVLLAQVTTTSYMTRLVGFVQVVHYPHFENVGKLDFSGLAQRHTGLTAWGVGHPQVDVKAVPASQVGPTAKSAKIEQRLVVSAEPAINPEC